MNKIASCCVASVSDLIKYNQNVQLLVEMQ